MFDWCSTIFIEEENIHQPKMEVLGSKNLCYDEIGVCKVLYMTSSNLISSNFHLFHKFTGLNSSLIQNPQFEIQHF